jgi:hypothetical protein
LLRHRVWAHDSTYRCACKIPESLAQRDCKQVFMSKQLLNPRKLQVKTLPTNLSK